MIKGKLVSTLLPSYVKLSKEDYPKSNFEKVEMEKVPYSSTIGSLMYATICIGPDIAFVVGMVNRYMSNPRKKHWEVGKGIIG